MFSGLDGISTLTSPESSLRSSVPEPIDCPMHRILIEPPPPGPTFMMEVMVLGAFGAQSCQELKTRAACDCDSSHETPNTNTLPRGKMRNTNWVAIPKLGSGGAGGQVSEAHLSLHHLHRRFGRSSGQRPLGSDCSGGTSHWGTLRERTDYRLRQSYCGTQSTLVTFNGSGFD